MKRIRAKLIVVVLAALLASCGRVNPTTPPSPTTVAPSPAAVAEAPTRTPKPTQPPTAEATVTPGSEQNELLAAVSAIGAEMEMIRGLDATQPVTNNLMSRSEMADYMHDEIDREYTPEEVENDTRAMAALDFVPEDYDLKGELVELYSAQVLGLYDDERNTLYVVSAVKRPRI